LTNLEKTAKIYSHLPILSGKQTLKRCVCMCVYSTRVNASLQYDLLLWSKCIDDPTHECCCINESKFALNG